MKNIIYKENSIEKKYSVQEIRTLQLNNWKDWLCYVPNHNIDISENGDMWFGACKKGGYVGNVYEKFTLSTESPPIKCPKNWCKCYLDLPVKKLSPDKTKSFEDPYMPKSVLWFLSKTCNFDCSYCPTTIHDRKPPSKGFEDIIKGIDNIFNSGWKNVKFSFWGGEPTLFPNYLEICKYLYDNNCEVITTTNGSRDKKYLAELNKYSNLSISIHKEWVKTEKMYETLKYISDNRNTHWIMVKCMVEPNTLNWWKEWIFNLTKDNKNIKNKLDIRLNSLFGIKSDRSEWLDSQMEGYSDKEIKLLSKYGSLT